MKVAEKINMTREELEKYGPINIVAFGDSVTHGAFSAGEIDYERVYWNVLRKKINDVRNYVPVNVINAGIGGVSAKTSLSRVDLQVLAHNPDLVIVCFGLNDVNGSLEDYINSLEEIFEKCKASGAEVIFMTPNMLNTYVSEDTHPDHANYAVVTAKMQNEGKMDDFMSSAVELAEKMDVAVCDCYSEWKKMSKTQDINKLLINRINHPDYKMHELFAQMLFETIFKENSTEHIESDSTMYNDK